MQIDTLLWEVTEIKTETILIKNRLIDLEGKLGRLFKMIEEV